MNKTDATSPREEKVRMGRLVKLKEADRSFDHEFWQAMGPEARFAAAWQMVLEVHAIKGGHVGESRLRRSVQNIERLRG